MDYEEFYYEVWHNIGLEEISDECKEANSEQLDELLFGLWRLNRNSGLLNPVIVARIMVLTVEVKLS